MQQFHASSTTTSPQTFKITIQHNLTSLFTGLSSNLWNPFQTPFLYRKDILPLRRQQSSTTRLRPSTPWRLADASAKRSSPQPRAAPAPYSLRRRYRGSPRWRAILHVDDAWAGKNLQQVPPDEAWSSAPLCLSRSGSGRGRRGHSDPRAGWGIPTVWLEGSDVKTSLVPNYTQPFFFPEVFKEWRANERVNGALTINNYNIVVSVDWET